MLKILSSLSYKFSTEVRKWEAVTEMLKLAKIVQNMKKFHQDEVIGSRPSSSLRSYFTSHNKLHGTLYYNCCN